MEYSAEEKLVAGRGRAYAGGGRRDEINWRSRYRGHHPGYCFRLLAEGIGGRRDKNAIMLSAPYLVSQTGRAGPN
jgi:hypothetical protein